MTDAWSPFNPRQQLRSEPGGGKPFARFLAYEGCLQVCLTFLSSQAESVTFLQGRCALLTSTFGLDSNILPLAADQKSAPSLVAVDWLYGPAPEASTTRLGSIPSCLPPQQPQPVVMANTQTTKVLRHTVIATATRLVPLHAFSSPDPHSKRPSWVEPFQQQPTLTAGYSWKSLFGLQRPGQLSVMLHVAGHDPSLITFGPSRRAQQDGHIVFGPDETQGRLEIIVQLDGHRVAGGALQVKKLWQLAKAHATPCPSPQQAKSRSHSLMDKLTRACSGQSTAESDPMSGGVWVDVVDPDGRRYGSVLITARLGTKVEIITTATAGLPHAMMPPPMLSQDFTVITSQPQEQTPVTSWEAYDCCLAAAIRHQERGRRRLPITGNWAWLLQAFAETYGVRSTYATLSYLGWVVKPDVISCTTDCLQLLTQHLKHLQDTQAVVIQGPQDGLMVEEVALLKAVQEATKSMLAQCFQKYYAVSDSAPTGILDGDMANPESPAPVLKHAVKLADVLQQGLKPNMTEWLTSCLQVAAACRFEAVDASSDRNVRGLPGLPHAQRSLFASRDSVPVQGYRLSEDVSAVVYNTRGDDSPDFQFAYAQLEGLCQSIMSELKSDLMLHDTGVFPQPIQVPQITSAEYCKLFLAKLRRVLQQSPPSEPSSAAINLMLGVGRFQEFIEYYNVMPSTECEPEVDAYTTFLPCVQTWVEGSQAKLLHTCQALEGSGGTEPLNYVAGDDTGHGVTAPLLIEMLHNIQTEIQRYERLVNYWPMHAPMLEEAVCTVLRAVTVSLTRQCGLMPARRELMHASSYSRSLARCEKPVFQWQQPPQVIESPVSPQLRRGLMANSSKFILPFEAVLLNSLRRLLTFVPQTNDLLTSWARTTADSPGRERMPTPNQSPTKMVAAQDMVDEGPRRGALFNQLVKELRSEFAAAVTACAQRIHSALADSTCSIRAALEQYGVTGDSGVMQEQVHPTLEAVEDVLANLFKVLDSRVYVSVGRGLWDCTSQDVYEYLEGLQEGLGHNRGAWRGRQNASAVMSVVDNFFSATFSGTLGHEIHARDLDQPLHSDKTHKLLAENTTAINMSYTVY